METAGARTRKQPRPQWIGLALPAQHGAWGFWLEPALAGLIAAPSPAGAWLVLAGLGALLLHHPLMVAYKDLRRGRTFARTRTALLLAAIYALVALWAVLIARALTSVLYIRERLRLEKGKPADKALANGAHVIGIAILVILAVLGVAPWLPVLGGLVLAARAWQGLSERRRSVPAKILGFRELAYGVLYALLTGTGYRMLY